MTFGRLVPFSIAVRDATGGNVKIQRKDFLSVGALPVIDQGQEEISGYTNDMSAAYSGDLPVVLFGDHTRAFKYVDQPFALGADGVKVLAPQPGFYAKFLYYYFLSCDIPSHGYSRHFKFLKEFGIPLFSPKEQSRIVELLDEADHLRRLRREADAKAVRILPALFLKMFGDPATNPMGWPKKPIGQLGNIVTGKTPPTQNEGMFGGPIPFATPSDLDIGLRSTQRTVTEAGARYSKTVRAGSALVGCIGNIGKMAKTPVLTALNQQINAVEWGVCINDDFGIAALSFVVPTMQALATSTTLPILNKTGFSTIQLVVPPISMQVQFSKLAVMVQNSLNQAQSSSSQLEKLFEILLARSITGQLTAKWREAHMKELLAEMEQQARALNLPLEAAR